MYFAAYLIIGYDILKKAFKGIVRGQVFDENFLMSVATVGAIALAIYEKSGDYNEAIAVMLFYQIGELFQSYAVGKSRRNISELMDIRPDYANIERDGKLVKVAPDEVLVGSIITVMPGEKIPIDGVVVDGASTLNTGALTGESLPRDVRKDDEVVSGCINMTGVLKIRTSKNFGESTVSKILELVESSGMRKSRPRTLFLNLHVFTRRRCAALRLRLRFCRRYSEWFPVTVLCGALDLPCADVSRNKLSLRVGYKHTSYVFCRNRRCKQRGVCL